MESMQTSDHCWCGDALLVTPVRGESFRLLLCQACGCYRIDPPPIASADESSEFYTAYYGAAATQESPAGSATSPAARAAATVVMDPAAEGRHSRFWDVVRQVPELAKPGGKVIDFGSGEGGLCNELSRSGWTDVTGIEVSRSRAARARQRYPHVRFLDRPLSESVVAPGVTEMCVMDNVIEHLPDPLAVVAELRRYLQPGGKLVVITPNMESGHFRLLGRRWTPELAPHAHIYLFTPASMHRLLAEAGFVVRASGTFHLEVYPFRDWLKRLLSGDVKGAVWRAYQELGGLYGRFVGAGAMLYAVGEVPAGRQAAEPSRGARSSAAMRAATQP